jgi:hypothetical protein
MEPRMDWEMEQLSRWALVILLVHEPIHDIDADGRIHRMIGAVESQPATVLRICVSW